jgi:hypothetical protein
VLEGKGDLVAMRRQELSWLHYIPSVELSCLERSARICARILYNAQLAETLLMAADLAVPRRTKSLDFWLKP